MTTAWDWIQEFRKEGRGGANLDKNIK